MEIGALCHDKRDYCLFSLFLQVLHANTQEQTLCKVMFCFGDHIPPYSKIHSSAVITTSLLYLIHRLGDMFEPFLSGRLQVCVHKNVTEKYLHCSMMMMMEI
jgi:hypothetical protein